MFLDYFMRFKMHYFFGSIQFKKLPIKYQIYFLKVIWLEILFKCKIEIISNARIIMDYNWWALSRRGLKQFYVCFIWKVLFGFVFMLCFCLNSFLSTCTKKIWLYIKCLSGKKVLLSFCFHLKKFFFFFNTSSFILV